MKTGISQDGTIGDSGAVQPDTLLLPYVAFPDPGIVPAPLRHDAAADTGLGAADRAAAGSTNFVETSDQSSYDTISAAGLASAASGGAAAAELLPAGSIVSASLSYAPLVITPVFGTSITSLTGTGGDPTTAAEVEAAIDAAADYYAANWTSSVPIGTVINGGTVDTVTIPIQFDYGTLNGAALSANSGVAGSHYQLTYTGNGLYPALHAAVSGALPNLPATDPTGGGIILETMAQSQLLGLSLGGTAVDGDIGLNSIPNGITLDYNLADQSMPGQIGALGAIEHEISEVLGREADLGAISLKTYTVFDLYRFSAPNTPALTAGPADYFSLNNGTTMAGYFNDPNALRNGVAQGGDTGDWASSGPHDVVADAFDAFLTTGTAGTISSLDTSALGAIGLQQAPAPRTLVWTGAQGGGFATAGDWIDITNGLDPAQSAPDPADTTQFPSGGGTVTGSGFAAALQFGGTALWTIASGASLSALAGVTVGPGGGGALLVNGGAGINGLGASDTISGGAGGQASVTVDGTGSAWRSAGELIVGDLGAGSLTISDQGSVSAAATALLPAMVLGAGAGGYGTLSVAGAGSRAVLTGELDLGQAGAGQLQISGQGTLQTGGAAVAPAQGFDIARQAGGSGSATVTGTNSLLTNTGAFIVGDAGLGSLSVQAGGTVSTSPGTVVGLAGLVIANSAAASGSSIALSGAGSQLKVSGLLDVGAAGSGALQLSGGATLTAGSLDAGDAAPAVGQIGLTGTGTSLSLTGAGTIADSGTGVLAVLSGGSFTAASLTVGGQAGSSGSVFVSGTGSALTLTGALNIGTALGTGDLTIGAGATVTAAVVHLRGDVAMDGGLLDPTVLIENPGSSSSGYGTIESNFIILEGTILSNGGKPNEATVVVEGTVLGGGTLTINGTQSVDAPGVMQIGGGDTIELTGPGPERGDHDVHRQSDAGRDLHGQRQRHRCGVPGRDRGAGTGQNRRVRRDDRELPPRGCVRHHRRDVVEPRRHQWRHADRARQRRRRGREPDRPDHFRRDDQSGLARHRQRRHDRGWQRYAGQRRHAGGHHRPLRADRLRRRRDPALHHPADRRRSKRHRRCLGPVVRRDAGQSGHPRFGRRAVERRHGGRQRAGDRRRLRRQCRVR